MSFAHTLFLGPEPCDESCAQVGDPGHHDRVLDEARLFVEAVRRACGAEPDGARLAVTRHAHAHGPHLGVSLVYDGDSAEAAEYARRAGGHAPAAWAEVRPAAALPADGGKVYRFARTDKGVVAAVTGPGGSYPLPARLDLRAHSPDGFEWGYHGSGPAQAALALCADALGDELALLVYQDVKRRVVARQAGDGFAVTQSAVISAAREVLAGRPR